MTDSRMRDEDGFLTEHDPEPREGFFPKAEDMLDLIPGVCSQCRSNTTFEMDPYEGEPMSVCCWRPMWNPPDEPDMP